MLKFERTYRKYYESINYNVRIAQGIVYMACRYCIASLVMHIVSY